MSFFDEVYNTVAPTYRQINPDYIEKLSDKNKQIKKPKEQSLSLAEINERA